MSPNLRYNLVCYLKNLKIILIFLSFVVLELPATINAEKTKAHNEMKELNLLNTETSEEVIIQEFVEEFINALQTKDSQKIHQLLTKYPDTAENAYQRLKFAGKEKGEKAKQYKHLSKLLKYFQHIFSKSHPALDSLHNEGERAYYASDYPTALKKWKQGLDQAHKMGEQRYISQFLTNIGLIYYSLAQYQEALKHFQQALEIKTKIEDERGISNILTNMGTVYDNLGKYQQALNCYEKALTINRQFKDKSGEAINLTNIGVLYKNFGQYQKALECYQQALKIHRNTYNRRGEGATLSNIGIVYWSAGRYQDALEYYQQALAINREIGDESARSGDISNIGTVYYGLGQYQKALTYYKESSKIRLTIGDKKGLSTDLINIGVAYSSLNQPHQALDSYLKALQLHRETGDKQGEAGDLANIGVVYKNFGQYQKALECYQKALQLHREIGHKRSEAMNMTNIGEIYKALSEYSEARTAFQTSIAIHQALGTTDDLWLAQRGLASLEVQFKHLTSAVRYYEDAIKNIEGLRKGVKEKESKISFIYQKIYVYDELIKLCQNLHSQFPNKHYEHQSFQTFEKKQARVTLDEVGESSARRFAGIPEHITEQEAELLQQLQSLSDNIIEAYGQGRDSEYIHTLESQRDKLKNQYQILEDTLQKDYPTYYALKHPTPVAAEVLRQKVLHPDELLVAYNVREEATDLWLITPQHFETLVLPLTEDVIDEQVKAFRDSGVERILHVTRDIRAEKKAGIAAVRALRETVNQTLSPFLATSYSLYQHLFPEKVQTLIRQIKPKTLTVIPTGALYSLPFEALATNPDSENPRYLIHDHAVTYLSSASLLKTIRDVQSLRKNVEERHPILAFANPVYPENTCKTVPEGNSAHALRARAYHEHFGNTCFAELPESLEEAREILKLFRISEQSQPKPLHAGRDASLRTIEQFNKAGWLSQFQYLLFSTHAVLPESPDPAVRPAVVLSHPEQGGYLTVDDVFGLQLNADLVHLSACNTGQGENIWGEGVRGLTRAFMYAGTPAVSVTLWETEARSAKQLSINFFTHLKNRLSIAESLRQTKLGMIANDSKNYQRHPYFWAPLVIFGDGNFEHNK